MAQSTWIRAINPFDSATRKNFKKMLIIASDHDSKLAAQVADAAINVLFLFLHPLYLAYSAAYTAWQSADAAYTGATAALTELMKTLSSEKIEEWDIAIQVVYKQKTSQYKALLPNGRAPFQTGAYELRITAIATLISNIDTDASLAAVKALIQAFYTDILNSRNAQQGKEGLLSQKSDELEQKRVAVAEGMYFTLGGLMQKFYQNTIKVEEYYDLELIRNTDQGGIETDYNFTIDPNTHIDSGIVFEEQDRFIFENTGTTPIFVGRSDSAGGVINPVAVEIGVGLIVEKKASELGNSGDMFLTLDNKTVVEGSLKVTHVAM